MESLNQFEIRKQDHMVVAMNPNVQTHDHGFTGIELIHEALPDLNFSEINLSVECLGKNLSSPLFVSSMTAGHSDGRAFNTALAKLSASRKILMGVGSQRRELSDVGAKEEWQQLRKDAPGAVLVGNLGLAQVIQTPVEDIQTLVDNLQAVGLFIHLNGLQEVLQPEGTPNFKGGFAKIEKICQKLSVPVIIKEVGCGFSVPTLQRLESAGVYAVDVSGFGGTHWGRIEGLRSDQTGIQALAAQTFENWGISTLDSLMNAKFIDAKFKTWASGGIRNGLEAAKALAIGAEMVGLAQPWLAAFQSYPENPQIALEGLLDRLNFELKTALFCTGSKDIEEFKKRKVWKWRSKI